MFPAQKKDESFVWVRDLGSARNKKSTVWERLTGKTRKDDDDDDMPGPNAGATLMPWPRSAPRKTAAFAY